MIVIGSVCAIMGFPTIRLVPINCNSVGKRIVANILILTVVNRYVLQLSSHVFKDLRCARGDATIEGGINIKRPNE